MLARFLNTETKYLAGTTYRTKTLLDAGLQRFNLGWLGPMGLGRVSWQEKCVVEKVLHTVTSRKP